MEVVYMVRHIEAEYDDGEDDGDWQPHPQQEYQHQHEAGSTAGGGDRSPRRQEMKVEENPFDDENATLADIRRQMRVDKRKQVVYNVDKGKQPMQYEEKSKQVYNPNPQPKLILGGNDKPRNFQGGGERPRQNVGTVTSSSVPPDDKRKDDNKLVQEEQWETAVSKKTAKMLKQLEGVLGVKWKSPTEPLLNLKGLPKVQASTSKQHLSQASSSKPGKPKFFKKKTKLKKSKKKKTVTQRVIDSLDEYYQTVRQPIKLADFMSGLKIGEIEEDGDANPLPTEVCRVISVVPSMPVNEEYVKREAPEACMMVLPMDCVQRRICIFQRKMSQTPT
ncbi:hypothetical protein M5K25_008537 [Dendrobium thyrsiflorum]|uniref:Uncharacterized protein n=1 Tax=Dendrobium thyrsiflorum TaxID=117978 RepID=A0ABD0VFP2_DENTH